MDVNLLFQNARERVPQLAKGIGGVQSPEVFSPFGAESFDIGELTTEDKEQIPLARVKPVFIRSNFQDEEEMASDYSHITAREAATLAREAEAGRLFLTHISRRYREKDVEREAREVFPNSEVVRDFDKFLIKRD